jgi:hypothetical protein
MRTDYSSALKGHLSQYKVSTLKIAENGLWRKKQPYPHILPFKHRNLNILEPFRPQFWESYRNSAITLHPDFHHLNSSQAMCFNLFFPFISEENADLQLLTDLFRINEPVSNPRFEFVLDPTEGTNFDFCLQGQEVRYFFELKLTERNFGGCKNDNEHQMKFEKVYRPLLKGMLRESFCSCQNRSFPIRRTSRSRLREVDFQIEGHQLRGLEQNPETASRWAQLSRQGKKVMQFLQQRRYITVVVDGKVQFYGGARMPDSLDSLD